jgi:transcriptional repressor NrdR
MGGTIFSLSPLAVLWPPFFTLTNPIYWVYALLSLKILYPGGTKTALGLTCPMRCPFCHHNEDRVVDSRSTEEGTAIRRRRECLKCGGRFTSYERVEVQPLMVIKKDGRREPFDRNKIRAGIAKACQKRPISTLEIEQLVNDIERTICDRMKKEVESWEIGELVMDRLQVMDQVAYVRFASVYRRFEDVSDFLKEVKGLAAGRPEAGG